MNIKYHDVDTEAIKVSGQMKSKSPVNKECQSEAYVYHAAYYWNDYTKLKGDLLTDSEGNYVLFLFGSRHYG